MWFKESLDNDGASLTSRHCLIPPPCWHKQALARQQHYFMYNSLDQQWKSSKICFNIMMEKIHWRLTWLELFSNSWIQVLFEYWRDKSEYLCGLISWFSLGYTEIFFNFCLLSITTDPCNILCSISKISGSPANSILEEWWNLNIIHQLSISLNW